jgi:hypothetical protein
MSQTEEPILTHHGMLVVWGQFAQAIGLIQALMGVDLHQKTKQYRPQGKVLEFLVAILGGLEYLKDISLAAHPLDQDQMVAQAWQQPGWADHSGVSRTLSQLSEAEVQAIQGELDRISQPFIDREVEFAAGQGRLELDGDLSPRAVSRTSHGYPGAEYGHMLHNQLGLGYQAALMCLRGPTYGRLLLAEEQLGGSTVSTNQAQHLILMAEQHMRRRPLRRTDLLEQRIQTLLKPYEAQQAVVRKAEEQLLLAEQNQRSLGQQLRQVQQTVQVLEQGYMERKRTERHASQLAKARKRLSRYQSRLVHAEHAVQVATRRLERKQSQLALQEALLSSLRTRLAHFQRENRDNAAPIRAVVRLDAGFGTGPNLTWIIEMGYEVYSKPFTTWLSPQLSRFVPVETAWQRVGVNDEMVVWPHADLHGCPYPLDIARERRWVGKDQYRYSAFLHFGTDPVTSDLTAWFQFYNAHQTIEAGNKQEKQVFQICHLKVRARPALRLQEAFTLFAANFVRFASLWLAEQCPSIPQGWKSTQQPKVKQQVKVSAHCDAWVSWFGRECCLRFEDHSALVGYSFTVKPTALFQPVLPFSDFCFFSSV